MRYILLTILFITTATSYSQNHEKKILADTTEIIFGNRPEKQPVHSSGSDHELVEALYSKLPSFKIEELPLGTTVLSFTIDTSGMVMDPKISRSVHQEIDRRLLIEIRNHTFIPGELYGKKVETTMHIPIRICF